VEANDDIDMVSSLGGVNGYVGDLNSFGPSKIDVGDTEVCGLTAELESRLDEPELAIAVKLYLHRGSESLGEYGAKIPVVMVVTTLPSCH
jgi:hypothetical protein